MSKKINAGFSLVIGGVTLIYALIAAFKMYKWLLTEPFKIGVFVSTLLLFLFLLTVGIVIITLAVGYLKKK